MKTETRQYKTTIPEDGVVVTWEEDVEISWPYARSYKYPHIKVRKRRLVFRRCAEAKKNAPCAAPNLLSLPTLWQTTVNTWRGKKFYEEAVAKFRYHLYEQIPIHEL